MPDTIKSTEKNAHINNGLLEYYGAIRPKTVIIAMGSMVGTIKDAVDEMNKKKIYNGIGVIKIKCYRPFPASELLKAITGVKQVAVMEKAISLGATDGPLTLDVKATAKNKIKTKIQGFIVGLGGRDITQKMIKSIVTEVEKSSDKCRFVG